VAASIKINTYQLTTSQQLRACMYIVHRGGPEIGCYIWNRNKKVREPLTKKLS